MAQRTKWASGAQRKYRKLITRAHPAYPLPNLTVLPGTVPSLLIAVTSALKISLSQDGHCQEATAHMQLVGAIVS